MMPRGLRAAAGREHSMNHHEADIADVIIVLADQGQQAVDGVLATLKELGLEVVDVNVGEGVIEGNCDANKVHEMKKVPGVNYIRSVFTYVADYPTGDPRDQDGPDTQPERED
jgi:hypothetical protein